MKLLKLTSLYPSYLSQFYFEHPGLADRSFAEQGEALFYDAFGWGDAWRDCLAPMGYEVMEVAANAEPMQRAWARENLPKAFAAGDLHRVAVEQVRQFRPEVIWFDDHDAGLLRRIREGVPGIKLVLGWTGSALPEANVFADCDIVLSCSQESVDSLIAKGCRAVQMHHAFDPRLLARLPSTGEPHELIFIGQLIRAAQFHTDRQRLLEELVECLPLKIFSPQLHPPPDQMYPPPGQRLKRAVKRGVRVAYDVSRAAGIAGVAQLGLRAIGKDEHWLQPHAASINPRLRPYVSGGLYGLKMYQTIRDARITLNIHADSSAAYASNMRLFEVTGVSGCLLTDWRTNLPELFKPDEEVVTYRSAAECVEKARWLLSNATARQAIGRAGQARTLRDHTFSRRAEQLHQVIRAGLPR